MVTYTPKYPIPPKPVDPSGALRHQQGNLRNQPENTVRKSEGKIVARYT